MIVDIPVYYYKQSEKHSLIPYLSVNVYLFDR